MMRLFLLIVSASFALGSKSSEPLSLQQPGPTQGYDYDGLKNYIENQIAEHTYEWVQAVADLEQALNVSLQQAVLEFLVNDSGVQEVITSSVNSALYDTMESPEFNHNLSRSIRTQLANKVPTAELERTFEERLVHIMMRQVDAHNAVLHERISMFMREVLQENNPPPFVESLKKALYNFAEYQTKANIDDLMKQVNTALQNADAASSEAWRFEARILALERNCIIACATLLLGFLVFLIVFSSRK